MRLHLRLVALCTGAVLAAGCANHDNPTSSTSATNRLATTAQCDVTFGDRVWFDTNCDGIQGKDETGGPEGVKVTATNCDTQQAYGTATG
jgi:hypothetical protein